MPLPAYKDMVPVHCSHGDDINFISLVHAKQLLNGHSLRMTMDVELHMERYDKDAGYFNPDTAEYEGFDVPGYLCRFATWRWRGKDASRFLDVEVFISQVPLTSLPHPKRKKMLHQLNRIVHARQQIQQMLNRASSAYPQDPVPTVDAIGEAIEVILADSFFRLR